MTEDEPRELTTKECTEELLTHFRTLVRYWATTEGPTSTEDRLDGLVFSILSTLDGASLSIPSWRIAPDPGRPHPLSQGVPGWRIAPDPHEDDREYCVDLEENWWPDNNAVELKGEYRGQLHELWAAMKKTR